MTPTQLAMKSFKSNEWLLVLLCIVNGVAEFTVHASISDSDRLINKTINSKLRDSPSIETRSLKFGVLGQRRLKPLTPESARTLARDILKELIETNTTPSGSTTVAANAMARRLIAAGFEKKDVIVLGPTTTRGNLIVRIRGTDTSRPILLMGHLDVVDAPADGWSTDPFKLTEKDGYFYGRGTQDMKDSDAIMLTTFIRLKREGYKPKRDIILALTADEEGGPKNGVDWLLRNHRDLIDAEYAINPDGGGVFANQGRAVIVSVQTAEKLYADYQLTTTHPGGHSSLPDNNNAINRLARALDRLDHYQFPFELNETTRAALERRARTETAANAADIRAVLAEPPDAAAIARLFANPTRSAILHTTCIPTRIVGGHANNALPQMARAVVNCRILPGHSALEVQQTLLRVVDDSQVIVQYINTDGTIQNIAPAEKAPLPAPISPELLDLITKVSSDMWPGTPVHSTMIAGASDSVRTSAAGIRTYGVSGVLLESDDIRAHGTNERVRIESYYQGLEFFYRLLERLTSAGAN